MKLILVVLCACAVAIMAVPGEQGAEGVSDVVSQILDQIAKRVDGASAEQVGTVVKRLLATRQNIFGGLMTPFLGIANDVENMVGDVLKGVSNVGAGVVNATAGAVSEVANLAGVVPVLGPSLKGVGDATAGIGAAVSGALTGAGTGLDAAAHTLTNIATGFNPLAPQTSA